MQDFSFHRPDSVATAVASVRAADEGKFYAGGQSLLPVMKLDMAAPTDLISLAGIPGLDGIRVENGAVIIGAMATHTKVEESAEVRGAIPALADMAGQIGDRQVRNRGTLGGSVAHNDPAADYPAALLALEAVIVTDRREIPADDFFLGLFETPLEEDELITAVKFPVPSAAAYAKFPNPASKYALVGVMVAKNADGVRVAVTGAGDGVFRVPEMEAALGGFFGEQSLDGVTFDNSRVGGDPDASQEYRTHLVGVLARRAVAACV